MLCLLAIEFAFSPAPENKNKNFVKIKNNTRKRNVATLGIFTGRKLNT
jgi:hypothetical protein